MILVGNGHNKKVDFEVMQDDSTHRRGTFLKEEKILRYSNVCQNGCSMPRGSMKFSNVVSFLVKKQIEVAEVV